VLHILALSRTAVLVRHWFEINLDDASMEHGARIELRELAARPHRGSESAAQVVSADRPLWRADLFDRLTDAAGSFGAAHYHPRFCGNEPCGRVRDPALTADPWGWLGDQLAGQGGGPGDASRRLDPADAAQLSGLADEVVRMARRFSPARCGSAADCFALTRDVRETVALMVETVRERGLLDADWLAPWTAAAAVARRDDSGRADVSPA
jgi:hypothetical protein